METTTATLKRHEVRKAILSQRGLIASIAKELNVSSTLITQVLKGRATSKRIYDACESRALQILTEKSDQHTAGAA